MHVYFYIRTFVSPTCVAGSAGQCHLHFSIFQVFGTNTPCGGLQNAWQAIAVVNKPVAAWVTKTSWELGPV